MFANKSFCFASFLALGILLCPLASSDEIDPLRDLGDCVFGIPSGSNDIDAVTDAVTTCAADRVINNTLDGAIALANRHGKTRFGSGFQIKKSINFSIADNGSLLGEMDMIMPLINASDKKTIRAMLAYGGISRWTDSSGARRNDTRFGLIRRFHLKKFRNSIFGVSALWQQNLEYGHERMVLGLDYAGRLGKGFLNHYAPLTDWQAGRTGYQERAAGGVELGLQLQPTSTISWQVAVGRWEEEDGAKINRGRMEMSWQAHSYLKLYGDWQNIGADDDVFGVRAALSIPLQRQRNNKDRPRWKGFGVATQSQVQIDDLWRIPTYENRIEYIERKTPTPETQKTADKANAAQLRFLQTHASSGSTIKIEVSLAAAVTEDTTVRMKLAPGSGDDPVRPGVDYTDEPIAVLIHSGERSAIATVKLLHNQDMKTARSIRVDVLSVG